MSETRREPDPTSTAPSLRGRVSALNGGLAKGLMFISCAIVLAMVLHIVADVLLRFLLNQPLAGTIEIVSTWYMVALAFLPLGYVQWRREHLIVEIFTQHFSARAIRFIDGIVYLICVGVLLVYIWQVTITAIDKTRLGESAETAWFDISVWPTRWFLPIGLGAMAICMLVQVVRGMQRPESESAAP